jgi:hypothetical protein
MSVGGWWRVTGPTLFLLLAAIVVPFVAGGAAAMGTNASAAPAPVCLAAGSTGLNATIVATPHEKITGFVNATGCDIGVYVGPGVRDVHVVEATISNANDHGIFVQDAPGTVIIDNVVAHNGLAPHRCSAKILPPCILEDKAIELSGTSKALVRDNVVIDNIVDGGIGVSDDGPIDPGAPAPGTNHTSWENEVSYNTIVDNAFGCGIVLAAYDPGGGVARNVVVGNSVVGSAPGTGPFVGGIVVAADAPNTSAWHNLVKNNRITESIIPGIVVHSNAPGDRVWGNSLIGNLLVGNGFQSPPNDPIVPTAIEVVAEAHPGEPNAPKLTTTLVQNNLASHDIINIWLCDATSTTITDVDGSAPIPVQSC